MEHENREKERLTNILNLWKLDKNSVFDHNVELYNDLNNRIFVFRVCQNINKNDYKLIRYHTNDELGAEWERTVVVEQGKFNVIMRQIFELLLGFQSGFKLIDWSTFLAYRRVVHLLATMQFYGNFKPETPNEHELVNILKRLGLGVETEEQLSVVIDDDILTTHHSNPIIKVIDEKRSNE